MRSYRRHRKLRRRGDVMWLPLLVVHIVFAVLLLTRYPDFERRLRRVRRHRK